MSEEPYVGARESATSLRLRAHRYYDEGIVGINRRDSMLRQADIRQEIELQFGKDPSLVEKVAELPELAEVLRTRAVVRAKRIKRRRPVHGFARSL